MTPRWIGRLAPLALALSVLAVGCSDGQSPFDRDVASRIDPVRDARDVQRGLVRTELAAHRAQQIARLRAYAETGQFPHNVTTAPTAHMFKDEAGRLCAVANLIHLDGRDDLVDRTAREKNDLAIADVRPESGADMMEWVLASGLTQEELTRIQLPLPQVERANPRPVRPQPNPRDVARNARDLEHALTEARMQQVIRAHVANVEAELEAATEPSLDVAAERWIAAHGAPTPLG